MARVLLVRHGKAAERWDDYDHLAPVGEQQASQIAARLLREPGALRGFHGTLRRQRRTAEIVEAGFAEQGRTLSLQTLPGLDELDQAVVGAALALDPARANDAEITAWTRGERASSATSRAFMIDAYLRYAAGEVTGDFETFASFRARVADALGVLARTDAETVVAFTSGGFIATAVGVALEANPVHALRIMAVLHNASVSELLYSRQRDRFTLVRLNDVQHLPSELQTIL